VLKTFFATLNHLNYHFYHICKQKYATAKNKKSNFAEAEIIEKSFNQEMNKKAESSWFRTGEVSKSYVFLGNSANPPPKD